jgi:hypothetical protein
MSNISVIFKTSENRGDHANAEKKVKHHNGGLAMSNDIKQMRADLQRVIDSIDKFIKEQSMQKEFSGYSTEAPFTHNKHGEVIENIAAQGEKPSETEVEQLGKLIRQSTLSDDDPDDRDPYELIAEKLLKAGYSLRRPLDEKELYSFHLPDRESLGKLLLRIGYADYIKAICQHFSSGVLSIPNEKTIQEAVDNVQNCNCEHCYGRKQSYVKAIRKLLTKEC